MVKPYTKLAAIAAPIMRSNIDTDVIIRIDRLVGNSVRGTLGKWAFGALRYLSDGSENPEFILNREPYRQAEILVTGPNFGCGSSREGAVWSLQEMGIRAIIGSGFGDIFFANCFQNGILPIVIDKEIVDGLAAEVEATPGGGTYQRRSAGTDNHFSLPKASQFRDRSAPAHWTARRSRRSLIDAAARRRNPGLSDVGSRGATLDTLCKEIGMNNRSNMIKVAVVGGEGIGPEVTAQSHRILNWFAGRRGVPMILREAQYGLIPHLATSRVLPEATAEAMDEADAIVWGATGGPETKEVPAAARKAGSLLPLRSKYDLYADVRPIVANPALAESAPLKASVLKGVDFVIIGELTSGIYFGEPRGIETLADGQRRGFNTEQYTANQIRRVARAAFELAHTRKGRVCSVDKANVLETSALWREEVIALHAAEFSDIELSHLYVDNAAMQIVRQPSQFDVMVTGNSFGDILSDCAAMASGSLGMLPSASLGPVDRFGRRKALYMNWSTAARLISPARASPIRLAPFSALP
jgi:3-isopropylmalate dehydrogenase